MKTIIIDGQACLVDDADFDAIARHRWRLHHQGYAYRKTCRGGRCVTLLMHREIMKAIKGIEVDHANGCKMDNRRENLSLIEPLAHRMKHIGQLIAFQKGRQIYPDKKLCSVCGKVFTVNLRKRKRNKCCSITCACYLRAEGRRRQSQLRLKLPRHLSKPSKTA
jgi:hypothetical protein